MQSFERQEFTCLVKAKKTQLRCNLPEGKALVLHTKNLNNIKK